MPETPKTKRGGKKMAVKAKRKGPGKGKLPWNGKKPKARKPGK